MTESPRYLLEVENLQHRLYDKQRDQEFVVTVDQPLRIEGGSFVAILGPNGCGKTTLLTILGLLREPTGLEQVEKFIMQVSEHDAWREINLKDEWRREQNIVEIRRQHLGFMLQTGELLPALTVRENIMAPLHLNGGYSTRQAGARADELISAFKLLKKSEGDGSGQQTEGKLSHSRVNKISGGEFQRVALARAIAHRPTLVLIDEPTASLNRITATETLEFVRDNVRESEGRRAVLMVTHDEKLAAGFATQIVTMEALGSTRGKIARIDDHTPEYS